MLIDPGRFDAGLEAMQLGMPYIHVSNALHLEVLSIGDQLDPEQIGPVPGNAIIVKQAPQLELLKQTTVCITHAGLNTVLESLAQGVPQVATPVAFDQPGVAARIADKQTGVVISLEKLTAERLSTLPFSSRDKCLTAAGSPCADGAVTQSMVLLSCPSSVRTGLH
jgi:UDP-glucoronosyl and UDP-glucosyl transferase